MKGRKAAEEISGGETFEFGLRNVYANAKPVGRITIITSV